MLNRMSTRAKQTKTCMPGKERQVKWRARVRENKDRY